MNKKEKIKKMKIVRSAIDRIDEKILPLMVKRSKLVNKALNGAVMPLIEYRI